jgi:hypothetical protein
MMEDQYDGIPLVGGGRACAMRFAGLMRRRGMSAKGLTAMKLAEEVWSTCSRQQCSKKAVGEGEKEEGRR